MTRDELISVYVTKEDKKHIQAEATEAGETLSSYLYKLIQEQRRREGVDQAATELNAEERLEALIAEGTENLEKIAEDIKDINARAGVYSIANFELLKQNYSDARRKEVLETGAKRIRYPLEEHADLSDQGDTTTAQNSDSDREDDREAEPEEEEREGADCPEEESEEEESDDDDCPEEEPEPKPEEEDCP